MVMKAVAWVGVSVSNRNTLSDRLKLGMLAGPDQTGCIVIVRHDGPKEV